MLELPIIIDSPKSSYCGLPARPQSCLYSNTLIGLVVPILESYLLMFDIITRRAGRLTPAAKVGVAVNIFIRPLRNSDSII